MKFYVKPTAGHETHGQSAIIDEDTGESAAIVYNGKEHGNLFAAAPDLLAACERLSRAAANRENTMGDPLRLIERQAELRDATTEARAAVAKASNN